MRNVNSILYPNIGPAVMPKLARFNTPHASAPQQVVGEAEEPQAARQAQMMAYFISILECGSFGLLQRKDWL
jgi:hypothetical protein